MSSDTIYGGVGYSEISESSDLKTLPTPDYVCTSSTFSYVWTFYYATVKNMVFLRKSGTKLTGWTALSVCQNVYSSRLIRSHPIIVTWIVS